MVVVVVRMVAKLKICEQQFTTDNPILIVSSDRSSYSDDGLLYIYPRRQQQGHSCKIGNIRFAGTSVIQNQQFHEECNVCLLFTFQHYIESKKYNG